MDNHLLAPWMLQADWREGLRPYFIVDLDRWPADMSLAPLPPVPVVATGSADHPQARGADLLAGAETISLATIIAGITRAPNAAAVLVQLLRAVEGLPPERALPIESLAFAALQSGTEHATWLESKRPSTLMPAGRLHVSRRDDTLDLLIDRPDARNAIDRAMRDALHDAFALATLDDSIGLIRLHARGRCFSMGADLAEFGTTRAPVEAHAIRMLTLPALPLSRCASVFEVHIEGGCVGSGFELAAFASRITATRDAWFQLPEVAMGIIPGFGGCVSVPARIGRQRAAALMISGKRIDAQTALRWGIIDELVDGTIDYIAA